MISTTRRSYICPNKISGWPCGSCRAQSKAKAMDKDNDKDKSPRCLLGVGGLGEEGVWEQDSGAEGADDDIIFSVWCYLHIVDMETLES